MPAEEALSRETAAARRILPHLLPAYSGAWAVFHGDGLFDIRATMEDALRLAYQTFRPGDFLVVEIAPEADLAATHAGAVHAD